MNVVNLLYSLIGFFHDDLYKIINIKKEYYVKFFTGLYSGAAFIRHPGDQYVLLVYRIFHLRVAEIFIPIEGFRNFCTRILILLGIGWIDCNRFIIWFTQKIEYDVSGLENLPGKKEWVLIFSNHRSWVDIFMVQNLFNHRIPFLNFFSKKNCAKSL